MVKSIRNMLSLLRPYRGAFGAAQAAMLAATAAGLAFPWVVGSLFDTLIQGGGLSATPLLSWVGILAALFLLKEAANMAKNLLLGNVGQRMIRDLRAQVYQKLLRLSLDYYNTRSSGEIASSMSNDMNLLQAGLSSGLSFVLQQALTLVVVVIMMMRIDPMLTALVMGVIPAIMVVSRKMGARARAISTSTQERLGSLMSIIHESLSGMDVIKAFVLEGYALGLFRGENERILKKSVQGIRVGATSGLLIGLLNSAFFLLIIGLGGARAAGGYLSAADLISFILYSEMVAGPISTLAGLYVELNKASAAFERISDILDAQSDIQQPDHPVQAERLRGAVDLEQVAFSYDGQHAVLHDVTLSISPGEQVALVGPSGAGKSTLVKLIPRFYDPDRGKVRVDGVDATQLDLQQLRQQIAVVPQDTHLFGFSIRDNIACGRPEATEKEIVHAAQLANAHEFVTGLEQGYDTEIGENGARLSGGQRQRIAIARAFLKNPRILLLDEATSALDAEAESKVQTALDTLMRGRTTVIIAHRLSTIKGADRIVVLKEGRVLATGPHPDLLQSCPFYRRLYQKQFAGQSAPAPTPAALLPAGQAA